MTPGNIHPKSELIAHPLAATFPMMDAGQMAVHVDSIKSYGQKTKIVLHLGQVADGRNTLYACLEAGRVPEFREFGSEPDDGESLAEFVITHNLHRRHMSPSQRTTAAVEIAPFFEAEAQERMKATQFKGKAADIVPIERPAAPVIEIEGGAVAGEGSASAETEPLEIMPEDTLNLDGAAGQTTSQESGTSAGGDAGQTTGQTSTPKPASKSSTKGSAVQKAADMFKVSPTMVKLGKRLKRLHPDLYEDVKNNVKTVHEADAEAQRRDKEKESSISKKAERTERLEALKHIEKQHAGNPAFIHAVTTKTALKKHSDLLEFCDMPKKKAFTILPLIKLGWAPKKALEYVDARATEDTTVAELIAMAILAANVEDHAELTRAFVVGKFTITLHREGMEEEVQTAHEAAAQVKADAEPQESTVELEPQPQGEEERAEAEPQAEEPAA